MNQTGINRRHFLAILTTALSATACTSVVVPRLTDGPPRVPTRSLFKLGPAPVKIADAKFSFIQINGAPTKHLMAFTRALKKEAAERNLVIVPEDDPSATYRVKGYLSAISDGGGSLLVFVWDVTDSSGHRLHRFAGQETSGRGAVDPWTGISSEAVDSAAQRTIDDLVAWAS